MGLSRRRLFFILIVVTAIHVTYIVSGAAVFVALEGGIEPPEDDNGTCTSEDVARRQEWNYFNSVYFCMVMLTTIGFGDLAPETPGGRAFAVIYGSIGVPLTFWLVSVAIAFGISFAPPREKSTKKCGSCRQFYKTPVFLSIMGFWLFVLASAGVFALAEEWNFGDAFYFAFITFTTIGFGDLYVVTPFAKVFVFFSAISGVAFFSFVVQKFSYKYKDPYDVGSADDSGVEMGSSWSLDLVLKAVDDMSSDDLKRVQQQIEKRASDD